MKYLFLVIASSFVLCQYLKETEADGMPEGIEDPDVYRNVSEIIADKGYPVEEHTVLTDDGYILSVQRIPHGRRHVRGQGKEVVLLIHGILGDANTWVLNYPDQSLGYILPDAGYDVWLLNTRGCDYSKKHVKYQANQLQFWDFSFQEVAQYDFPATIDYILSITGKETLYIIGYSQGTTASFAMLSDMPDYNDKVKLLIALAPVAFLGHSTTAARLASPFKYEIAYVNDLFTNGEFFPDNPVVKFFRAEVCSTEGFLLCETVLFALGGVDETQLNKTRIDVYTAKLLTSTSTKSLLHFGQLTDSKEFRKYDYGRRRNLQYYQQVQPPDYETSHITAPVALISSSNDILADPQDVDILQQTLNNLVLNYQVPYPYNHFDFALAENAVKLIYEPILQLLAEY